MKLTFKKICNLYIKMQFNVNALVGSLTFNMNSNSNIYLHTVPQVDEVVHCLSIDST